MIIDYLDRSSPEDFIADVCIIGAGPAGISIARSFIGTSRRVCLVESGGLAGEDRNQRLYEGTSIGLPELDPATSRMRAFGGSCNVWGGGCIPLSNLDLGPRDWVPHSGWPLNYEDLEPYYRRAREVCGIEAHEFVEGSFLTPPARTPMVFDAGKLINQNFVLSPVFFGEAYRAEFEQAENITVLLHANLLELEAVESGSSVRRARIGALDGRRGTIRARNYVLACGGIENARLLLLSNSTMPNGLGNDHDLVGRYFMDHPSGKLGTLFTDVPDPLTRPYDRSGGKGPVPAFPELCLSDRAVQTHQLLSGRVRPVAVEAPVPKGVQALRDLKRAIRPAQDETRALEGIARVAMTGDACDGQQGAPRKQNLGKLGLRVGLGSWDIAHAVWRKWANKPTVKSDHVDVIGYFEQAPNPDSRVTLGDEVDALGQRKICIDWRLTELDWHTYRTAANLFGAELANSCAGKFQIEPWLQEGAGATPQVRGTAHHLGTTRMSDDPQQGVVDRQCRVHGVDNLYVVGSSVFPTGGWAFPTFTIVALSMRLAEHLRALADVAIML
ncbi:GMC family oxidoreductase [Pseudoxanthomonas sp. CF125]|uniref:GMC oxidoreductase n=1 Tax=Pseudoxanthomonas sp. CF125 TaxID=1855303 RepID=UPI00088D6810|nr:GMC family oxidoreductase [Pseudoxanthomonas sp. CF125]SDQ60629.1 Choline dehydrogenase [Pseudoxanthomonas sp. CF125]